MTTSLATKFWTIFKVAILCTSISLVFGSSITRAESNEPIESKQITAFVYNTIDTTQVNTISFEPYTLNSKIEKVPFIVKAETDVYMNEVKKSLLKDFDVLVQQLGDAKPEDANKILSTVMKIRILELDDKIDESISVLTILNWKEKIMFTKKSKSKVELEIASLKNEIKNNGKERFIIEKLLLESEIKENGTDNTKKINRKINSI